MADMKEEELRFLKDNRKFIRTKVTKKCNTVLANLQNYSISECRELVMDFLTLKDKLISCDDSISKGLWVHVQERSILDQELECCDKYNADIVKVIRLLETRLESQLPVLHQPTGTGEALRNNKLKLPELPLPEYHHRKGESLDQFFVNFEGIIDKYQLSSYEKYVFLEKQVRNEPLILIKSLTGAQRSYEEAKALLSKAFALPIIQKFEAIKKMSNLKLSLPDPYSFISEMRLVLSSFSSLSIGTDTVLQYFVWNALPNEYQTQLLHITNSCKPDLKQIEDNIFEATDRVLTMSKHNSDTRSTIKISSAGFAANVFTEPNSNNLNQKTNVPNQNSFTSNFKICNLCSDGKMSVDHPINKCNKYVTPKSKVDKLKLLNCCIACAGRNHRARDCRFNFRNLCYHCREPHFSFLCLAGAHGSKHTGAGHDTKASYSEKINSGTVSVQFNSLQISNFGNNILPTFSCKLLSGAIVRGLKDSGAQTNFVSSKFVDKFDLPTLNDDVELTIKGFNSVRKLKTCIVRLELFFGKVKQIISAVKIPSVKTKLFLPGLGKLGRSLVAKGYSLADDFVLSDDSDTINNLDLVLGVNGLHCIPENTIVFGKPYPSALSVTPMGLLLMGDMDNLSNNVSFLPDKKYIKDYKTSKTDDPNTACLYGVEMQTAFPVDASGQARMSDAHMLQPTAPIKLSETGVLPHCTGSVHSKVNSSVIDEEGNVINDRLQRSLHDILTDSNFDVLNDKCNKLLNYDNYCADEYSSELDCKMVEFTLNNIKRDLDGKLIMPLLWRNEAAHLLGNNFNLCKQILKSNLKKLQKRPSGVQMVDDVIREQLELGIVEKIDNLPKFLGAHPKSSFLAHMPIFKLDRDTTKCRIVYLSNLHESDRSKPATLSHNQTILPGPSLNRKISTSLMQLRFDEKVLTYDIVKAFLQIKLSPEDQIKLCFLWFKDVKNNDFSIVAYKSLRLPFGLRCSPSVLMMGLYYILIHSKSHGDDLLKLGRQLYDLLYMDNGAVTTNSSDDLYQSYIKLSDIFSPYGIQLQQFVTNDSEMRARIAGETAGGLSHSESSGCSSGGESKLLGMRWDTDRDTLYSSKLFLDPAASSKRLVLRTIASNFDLFNIGGPIMNRAKLFMHDLQCQSKLGWDAELGREQIRDWKNISKQVNETPQLSIERFIGRRDGNFELLAYVDTSKRLFGAVIYMLDIDTGRVSFLCAKNRVVNKNLESKSIPSLELQAINLGVETLIDVSKELSGPSSVIPINISSRKLFTDSLVCMSWLQSYSEKFAKLNKLSVFVLNRLNSITRLCSDYSIQFKFCAGRDNPADCITRPFSYALLKRTAYLTGPNFSAAQPDVSSVFIPNPVLSVDSDSIEIVTASVDSPCVVVEPLLKAEHYSSFQKMVNVCKYVLTFIYNIKSKLSRKNRDLNFQLKSDKALYTDALHEIIGSSQRVQFPEIFSYFDSKSDKLKDAPDMVSQLNVFRDDCGILRVKCKIGEVQRRKRVTSIPILLGKNSLLTRLVVLDLHRKFNHAGKYSILSEFRKRFYVSSCFSVVKKCIRECVICRRLNGRAVKLNQSSYREIRMHPSDVPYRNIFIDYLGPFTVTLSGVKTKVYLLLFTCLWSRAISLRVCSDLSVSNFLRALQMHIFDHGLPETCFSDLGTQLVAGASIITSFLSDAETQKYFIENGIKSLQFDHYYKGCNRLGGLVEVCVKMVKKLLFGSIRNNVMTYMDFQYVVAEAVHMVNRRPISFKEGLRDGAVDECIPSPITPEMLLRGYELVSFNVIPYLRPDDSSDPKWTADADTTQFIQRQFSKLRKVRSNLVKLYNEQFIPNLIDQATDVKGRYRRVKHDKLHVGDIVLIKDNFVKPAHYPMAIVREVIENELEEVTAVSVMKGCSREVLKRHVNCLIPLLRYKEYSADDEYVCSPNNGYLSPQKQTDNRDKMPPRRAALEASKRNLDLVSAGLV